MQTKARARGWKNLLVAEIPPCAESVFFIEFMVLSYLV